MKITVKKLTDLDLLHDVVESTTPSVDKSTLSLEKAYFHRHSIIRTQLFYIKMEGIPYFVAMHFRTHSNTGQLWWVSTGREDRGGNGGDRWTPVTMVGILNAEHLMDLAAKRLCGAAHKETNKVMLELQYKIEEVDQYLAEWMVPKCWRMGYCDEPKKCHLLAHATAWRTNTLPVERDAVAQEEYRKVWNFIVEDGWRKEDDKR